MNATIPTDAAVVVTGTSTGIGRATALLLDRLGYRVFAGVRRGEDADSLSAEASSQLVPLLLDVTDASAVECAAKDVDAAVGERGIAGLVNNAGIGFGGPVEFVDLDAMRHGYEVNVFGPLAMIRAFMPLVRRARGRVINVSSGAGKVVTPLLGPYCSSKFALEAISDALRMEVRGSGIAVSVIEPGFIDTPMQSKGQSDAERMRGELPEEGRKLYGHAIDKLRENISRFGKRAAPPEAVASAIHRALTAERPKTRYTVGSDAKLLTGFQRLMPDRAKDALFGYLHDL